MSLEDTTGIFSGLAQLALTLIGSFVLVLAVRSRYALGAHQTDDHDDWPDRNAT